MASVVTKRARVNSSSAASPTAPHPSTPEPTSLNSLGDELIADILLRVPYESLTKAVLASKRCLRIASSGQFRVRYHQKNPTGYPILGHFSYFEDRGPAQYPKFNYAESFGNDPLGRRLVTSGDFQLFYPGRHNWRIHDCFGGNLLLSRGTSGSSNFNKYITVHNPLTRNSESVPDPPIGRAKLCSLFLLPSTNTSTSSQAASAFRLAGFQQAKSQVRLVVYDSKSRKWSLESWVKMDMPPENNNKQYYPPMHASRHVFRKYGEHVVLQVDATSMEMSFLRLPSFVVGGMPWCIGETEDQRTCLVYLVRAARDELHVRTYDVDNNCWVLYVQESLSSIIGSRDKLCHIDAVVDGAVVLCMEGTGSRPHMSFHLTTLKVVEKFDSRGIAFPYILPWPCLHKGEGYVMHHEEQHSAQCSMGVAGHAGVSGLTAGQPPSRTLETDTRNPAETGNQIPDLVIPTVETALEPHVAAAGTNSLMNAEIPEDGLVLAGGDVHMQGYNATHAGVSGLTAGQPPSRTQETDTRNPAETDNQIPDVLIPTVETALEPHVAAAGTSLLNTKIRRSSAYSRKKKAAAGTNSLMNAGIPADGLVPAGGDVDRQGYNATHAQVSSQCATDTQVIEETDPHMLADGAVMLRNESSQVLAGVHDQIPTGAGNEILTGVGHQSSVDAAQTRESTSHDVLQDTCLACKGNHKLLHCNVKWSLVSPNRFLGPATTRPFWNATPPLEIIPHLLGEGDGMVAAWFRVFGVPHHARSWPLLFETASLVGRLEDLDPSTIDGSNSNYIRMLIHLVTTDGAPFSGTVSYGPIHIQARFELDEN